MIRSAAALVLILFSSRQVGAIPSVPSQLARPPVQFELHGPISQNQKSQAKPPTTLLSKYGESRSFATSKYWPVSRAPNPDGQLRDVPQMRYSVMPAVEVNQSCVNCDLHLLNRLDTIGKSDPVTIPDSNGGSPPGSVSVGSVSKEQNSSISVNWKSLFEASTRYLGVMHGFRIVTEAGTRDGLRGNVIGGYFKALGAMHGWSDGDGYFENYLGHPIQGAVSGYIWTNNDPRFSHVEFGKDPDYWKSRLRAYAFSWAFSEQFEIGPISEASIGQIQRYCCQYGFVDHIITPNFGLAVMVGEDFIDKSVVRRIENSTSNVGVRIASRIVLNPMQSFANLMTWRYPWHRENRDSPSFYNGELHRPPVRAEMQIGRFEPPTVPTLEIAASVPSVMQIGGLSCLGGGAVAGLRLTDHWQWSLEVSGCTLAQSLPKNWSGDSLTFTTGPQWILHTQSRWTPHAHLRVGGQKITNQLADPEKRKQIQDNLPPGKDLNPYYNLFTTKYESTGFSLTMGTGVDYRLHPGVALRLANLDYVRSWLAEINQITFNHGLRFSAGVVLRLGTW